MFFPSAFQRMASCDTSFNCSSRGSCEEGVCVCSVQFSGDQCSQTNVGFTAAFSSLFSLLFLVSFVQLVLCIQAEHRRLKHASLWAACRITTQKLLYFLALIAALTRVLYFSLMGVIPDGWLDTMELAYHPLLITGMSLVVCYWSEAFFLEDVSANASRHGCFLSKSFVAFSIFNLTLYLTVIAQFIVVATGASGLISVDHWLNGAFQSFFAIVLFIVYIVFMTVGVEIFFKVRGAFNRREEDEPSTSSQSAESINSREVLKSRLAIVFQALFLLLMVLCVVSKAVETLWKDKVDVKTRSMHAIIHRMAEVGVVLWFPCVLWNTTCPERLWFLNPRCLLQLKDNQVVERLLPSKSRQAHSHRTKGYSTFTVPENNTEKEDISDEESECWICYDRSESAGPFISPCLCKGGMAKVHHSCLRRWLVESNDGGGSCHVCKHKYAVREEPVRIIAYICNGKRVTIIIPMLILCVLAPCLSVYVFRKGESLPTVVKVVILGVSIIVELVCLRVLGVSFSKLYHITRQSAMRILNYDSVEESVEDVSASTSPHKIKQSYRPLNPPYSYQIQCRPQGGNVYQHRTYPEWPGHSASPQSQYQMNVSSCKDALKL